MNSPRWRANDSGKALEARRVAHSLLFSTSAVLGAYLVLGFAIPVALALQQTMVVPGAVWAHVLEKPALFGVVGLSALVICARRYQDMAWCLVAFGMTVAGVVWLESGRIVASESSGILLLAIVLLFIAKEAVRRRWRGVPLPVAVLAPSAMFLAGSCMIVGCWPLGNRLGLVSGAPDAVEAKHYDAHPLKDDYPPCTIKNNSLGYRDAEPPPRDFAKQRILIVGDSFIWGDGIPDGQETLPALLRNRIEAAAPGSYDVTSAAHPGLGAYGYRRAAEAMIPEVQPDIIIVGYLGEPDLDPVDAQTLFELLPRSPWLARMVRGLGVMQSIHEVSIGTTMTRGAEAAGGRLRDEMLATLAAFARQPGHRAVLLCYHEQPAVAVGVDVLPIPSQWRYPGHRSELWYAKDHHPKPKLNALLAEWLALEIIHPGKAEDAALAASKADVLRPAAVINPGQEALVLDMLGGPDGVGGCRLTSAAIQSRQIDVTYDCTGVARAVTLMERTRGHEGSVVTAQFALSPSSPDVPPTFVQEIASMIRKREGDFRWGTVAPRPEKHALPDQPRPIPWRYLPIVGAALAAVAVGWKKPSRPADAEAKS